MSEISEDMKVIYRQYRQGDFFALEGSDSYIDPIEDDYPFLKIALIRLTRKHE